MVVAMAIRSTMTPMVDAKKQQQVGFLQSMVEH
jgi:hypothetical protein